MPLNESLESIAQAVTERKARAAAQEKEHAKEYGKRERKARAAALQEKEHAILEEYGKKMRLAELDEYGKKMRLEDGTA